MYPVRTCRGVLLLAVCLASLFSAQTAQAGLFDTTSSFTVNGINFPTTFSQTVAVSSTPTAINAGQLTLATTVFTDGPDAEWVDFNFQRVGGGPLANNLNGNWRVELDNLQMTQPTNWDGVYYYWTVNGNAVSPINPFGGFTNIISNPVNSSLGPVYGGMFPAFGPFTSISDIFTFVNPYNFISSGGMNPNLVNGFHIGMHFVNPTPTAIPEPSGLALLGVGGAGVIAWYRRRKAVVA